MSVGEKLKTDLNSAGPLVLKSTYATKKYLNWKYIHILLCLLNKKSSESWKNKNSEKAVGVGEKQKADLDSACQL